MAPPETADTESPARSTAPGLSLGKKLVFSLVILLLAFGLPEVVLRAFDYPPKGGVLDTTVGGADGSGKINIFWGLEANLKEKPFLHKELGTYFKVSTNSHSLRYAEIPVGQQPATIRILALGDSTTFGWGVEQDQTYPAELEKLLQAKHPEVKIEVLDGGVPGYTSFQGLHHYKHDAAPFKSDIVLFGYIVQDARKTRVTDKQQAINARSADFLRDNPFYRFNTYRAVRDWYVWLRAYMNERANTKAATDPAALTRVPLDDYRENIVTFKRLTDSDGARLILFGFPLEVVGYTREHRELLKQMAGELKVDHFDPSNVIADAARKQTLYFPLDKGHPNADGCRLIAEQLAGYLEDSGILAATIAKRK